jgi:hypothetical protein
MYIERPVLYAKAAWRVNFEPIKIYKRAAAAIGGLFNIGWRCAESRRLILSSGGLFCLLVRSFAAVDVTIYIVLDANHRAVCRSFSAI